MPLTQIGEVYLAVSEADGPVLWCDTVFPYISSSPPKNTKGGRQKWQKWQGEDIGPEKDVGGRGWGGGGRGQEKDIGGGGVGVGGQSTLTALRQAFDRVEQAYSKCPVPEMTKAQLDQVMD